MVHLYPILHTLDHELTHGFTLTCRLIATSAAVAIGAIGILAVEVVRTSALKIAAFNVPSMVIHHVQDDLDTGLVQSMHHLLELADAHFGLVGICRITALGHVIVHRVITPVVLRLVKARLINRCIVK